jgi:O-acetyl-ADP-ribose deacetylase (regulator of RNase III)
VNAVNTVGVMGKGIALQFRERFPEMFASYARACAAGEVIVGRMHVFDRGPTHEVVRWIINFPTKRHWREPSRLADVEAGWSISSPW